MKKERIIIVGGLSAGPSAAAKARRVNEECEIMLFEQTNNISYATCGIPYALSGRVKDREELMVVKAEMMKKRFNVDVHLSEPVVDVDTKEKTILTPFRKYEYDKLIFATGAYAYTPPIEDLDQYSQWSHCKTIENFDKIIADGVLETKERVVVIGGGLIGIEVAENLIKAGKRVTLIELAPQILPTNDSKFAHMAENVLRENGVDVRIGVSVQRIDAAQSTAFLSDGSSIPMDYLLIGVGVRPNTELLIAEGAEHLRNGAVVVNERMETSLPDVYAAGDCASIANLQTGTPDYIPMGTHSNKGGRAAGANAAGGNVTFEGAYRTAIVKVFDYTLARTGMNTENLKVRKIPFKSTFVIVPATPGFYPDQTDLFVEIYFDPNTKALLGAEVFGQKGVDKRIDVLSTCIYAKLTVDDLGKLDLAYAPPYSPAKDPVIIAGYVAGNSLEGHYQDVNSLAFKEYMETQEAGTYTLLDIRTPEEFAAQGSIPGAKNIPLDELRDRFGEIDREKEVFVYCQRGLRGYLGSLILVHYGFGKIRNIAGGFLGWSKIIGEIEAQEPVVA